MSTSRTAAVDQAGILALQDALAAEHAALWCYSLALAYLTGEQAGWARDDLAAHRLLRSQIEQTLTDLGQRPVSALPAYRTPRPVTDPASAVALAVVAESDAAGAWRSTLERSPQRRLRAAALKALNETTFRSARWRGPAGATPAVPEFPGRA